MITIYTIGHSDHPIEVLIGRLQKAGVTHLVDVRAQAWSQRHPQFRRQAFELALTDAGIGYLWEGEALGGRRSARPDSPHFALSETFRGYADHMAGIDFRQAIERLRALAAVQPVALMCAEGTPDGCHRSLIADYLAQCGHAVVHILRDGGSRPHHLSALARWEDERLIYDRGSQGELI